MEKTFWNGEPCKARKVSVIVGKSEQPTWWCADLEGARREAVEVFYGEGHFFLDNEDGSGWRKVTSGHGSPAFPHSSLPTKSSDCNHKKRKIIELDEDKIIATFRCVCGMEWQTKGIACR